MAIQGVWIVKTWQKLQTWSSESGRLREIDDTNAPEDNSCTNWPILDESGIVGNNLPTQATLAF
jgi:hypothetical protein